MFFFSMITGIYQGMEICLMIRYISFTIYIYLIGTREYS